MKKKKKNTSKEQTGSTSDGFNCLIDSHILALEDNSFLIEQALEALTNKQLSPDEKKNLNKINKQIKKLNKDLDSLGKDY